MTDNSFYMYAVCRKNKGKGVVSLSFSGLNEMRQQITEIVPGTFRNI